MPPTYIRSFAAGVATLLWLTPFHCTYSDESPLRALLVTGGCCHDYETQSRLIKAGLENRAAISVTVVQQGGTATDSKIPLYEDPHWADGYDIVIHNECFADVKDASWTQRVLQPHQEGVPAVLIHCAMHCYRDGTDNWFQFCGVTSHGHGSHYGHEVLNRDAQHPIMRNFGAGWSNPQGELYEIAKLWPTAHPLASAKNREQGREEVCVWTNQYGKARVFGTTLGHHNETVSDATFLDLLAKGTLWAAGKLNQDYLKPRVSVSPDTTSELLKDVETPDGFKTTVFAAPPAVKYPVFVAAAEDGTLYVAVDQNGSLDRERKRGAIYRLRDLDDDGRADECKLFVADVDSPRGMAWDHDRLYVMHPPHLSAFIDDDFDGISDRQDILVRDIAFTFKDRPADHTSNGVTMGIDGWLYLAIGDFGFMQAEGSDGRKLQLRGGGVVRVRPDGTGLQLYSNGTRNILEVAVDPLLNGFTRDNTNDGGGWDIRLHHFTGLEDHGYPRLYMNFGDEVVQPLADYGGGSGCGALYLDEPGFPDGMGNALYTADWGREKVFRHTLSPNGATFAPTQDDFVTLSRVTDVDVDANSRLYLSSWKGATFRYVGDEVGFVIQMRPQDYQPPPLPNFGKIDGDQLVEQLSSPSHRRRLAASRAIVRRGLTDTASPLYRLCASESKSQSTRVAALFTLKQLLGTESHAMLASLADVRAIQAYAIRALGDRWDQHEDVNHGVLLNGLDSTDARTTLESIVAIARLELDEFAPNIISLLTDTDPIVSHTARQALIRLRAYPACLAALDATATDNGRVAILHVLQSIHHPNVVSQLALRAKTTRDDQYRLRLLTALCRLQFVDGEWKGNSWGTRPDTRGPYYQPEAWEQTETIAGILQAQLEQASPDLAPKLVRQLSRHRIRLDSMTDRLVALVEKNLFELRFLLEHLREEATVPHSAKQLLVRLAKNSEITGDQRRSAVPILLRIQDKQVLTEILAWSEQDRAVAFTFARDSNLVNHVANLVELSHGTSSTATMALTGLLRVATSKRLSNEQRQVVEQVIESKWQNAQMQTLTAIRRSRNRAYTDRVQEALRSKNSEVAKLSNEIAKEWKLEPTSVGPTVKDLDVEHALAAAIGHRGSMERGRDLFSRLECGKCHTVTAGETLRGPHLPNVAKTYKRPQLAEAVLLPSKSIAQGFVTNLFLLDDGRQIAGFVTNEGDLEITIRNQEGVELKIPVESIEERITQKVSMMPEGLVKDITPKDFGALLSYLESLGEANP